MPRINYREESRKNWGRGLYGTETVDQNDLRTGAILRISDSLEKMEQPYLQLLRDVEWYKKRVESYNRQNDTLHKRIAAYKGVITKMKKKGKDI